MRWVASRLICGYVRVFMSNAYVASAGFFSVLLLVSMFAHVCVCQCLNVRVMATCVCVCLCFVCVNATESPGRRGLRPEEPERETYTHTAPEPVSAWRKPLVPDARKQAQQQQQQQYQQQHQQYQQAREEDGASPLSLLLLCASSRCCGCFVL